MVNHNDMMKVAIFFATFSKLILDVPSSNNKLSFLVEWESSMGLWKEFSRSDL